MLPPQVIPFLLTLAISTLIGVGLREYYEGEGKFDTFGSVRTFIFIGMLGFVVYRIPDLGLYAFLMGMAVLGVFLAVYYRNKLVQHQSPGLIGVLIAMLTYAIGPVAIHEPHWYLAAIGVTILLVLHSKGRIRRFTDRLETGEVVTVCKFLAITAVVLPLIPAAAPVTGWAARAFTILPVTPRQIWMAVVITTAISYTGYVLQTYLFPRKGMLLTGIIGGLYSSTMTTLVLSKRTRHLPAEARETAAAILLSTPTMYLRILFLVAAFMPVGALRLAVPFLVLSLLVSIYAWRVRGGGVPEDGPEAELELKERNPLEINSALLFALMFVAVTVLTKFVLLYFKDLGLRMLSFLVGASDIVPFIVSILQGNLGITQQQILQAIIVATASNNLMKAVYTYLFGNRKAALLVAAGMAGAAALSFLYVAVAF